MSKYDLKSSHGDLVRDMINDFYDELDGVVVWPLVYRPTCS